jgi:hypothetical protein
VGESIAGELAFGGREKQVSGAKARLDCVPRVPGLKSLPILSPGLP